MSPSRTTSALAIARLGLLVGLSVDPCSLRAQGKPPTDPVAVSSTSTAEYEQQKFGPGAPKPESYLFFQGTFYGGATRDKNLETGQFDQIVRILAENMVRQNYFPSKDPKNADLLVVVHWGVTTTAEATEPNLEDDRVKLLELSAQYNQELRAYRAGQRRDPPDQGPVNMQQSIVESEDAEVMRHIAINAKLLGYSDQIHKDEAAAIDGSNLYQNLNEERYFIILMAYDYHTMKKGSNPKLLWSTRFSMRAPGNFFTAAVPAMSKVASDYFGHALDGLKVEKPDLVRKGNVEVGTPTVVDP